MKQEDVTSLYDWDYVQTYDERFLFADCTRANAEFEHGLLNELLAKSDISWLDVACGTGWFLSQFPDVTRAGFDLSTAMLDLARQSNPGVEFRQGDFRLPIPEWRGKWSLVSCMWAAYIYVDTLDEVEALIANLVEWTAPGGTLLLPIIDLADLRNYDVTYCERTPFTGECWLNGVIWSWTDGDKVHKGLISPHVAQFLAWLAPHFDAIQVIHYPEIAENTAPRKALIARGRREGANPDDPARVDWPEPRHLPFQQYQVEAMHEAWLKSAAFEKVAGELLSRFRPGRIIRGARRRWGKSSP